MSRTLRTKVFVSAVAVAAAASTVALGTFGTFTSTTTAATPVTAGTVVIALGATGAATDRLGVAAAGLVPGDTIQRAVTLSNTGNQSLASLLLTTTGAATPTLLTSDTTNGLQMKIDKCAGVLTEVGTSAPFTYTCSLPTTSVVASRPVVGSNISLASLGAMTAGSSDQLVVTLTFPTTAGNTFQGLADTVNFSFTGTQRAATNQ